MRFSDFHLHCSFCHGEVGPEQFVQEAIALGLTAIGFSSHAPLPFDKPGAMKESNVVEYCSAIRKLQRKYHGTIKIYLGLEIDYFPGLSGPDSQQFKVLDLDYTIGSVHFVKDDLSGKYMSIAGSEEEFGHVLDEVYRGDIKEYVGNYYRLLRNMIQEHKPTIIGHFDLIKDKNKHSRYFCEDEDWYRKAVKETLHEISQGGVILEVNTGGISRDLVDSVYPSTWILRECRKLDIPVMINSDAHAIKHLTSNFNEALLMLMDVGYRKQDILIDLPRRVRHIV